MRMPGCRLIYMAVCLVLLSGCPSGQSDIAIDPAPEGIRLESGNDVEKTQLLAAKPFFVAITGRKYDDAFDQLSEWARKEFMPGQIGIIGNESMDLEDPIELTREKFVQLMRLFEQRSAIPDSVDEMYVETMDEEILAGGGDAFDRMMSIGSMPDSTPANIRTSAVRGHIGGRLTETDLAELRKEYPDATGDEFHDNYRPWLILKCVMVEEGAGLKVGYFELFIDND